MSELVTKIKDSVDVIHDIGCDYENVSNTPNIPDAYTKTETDALLAGKVDNDEVYSKAVLNAILDSKADEDNVYDKSQTYSKTEVDAALALKADAADVYTKTESDAALALKADAADVYTKTESDAALALKANAADVYTISQTDGLLDAKASVDDSSTTATMATWSADKLNVEFQSKADTSDTYTKAEVDALIGGLKMYPTLDFANKHTLGSSETYTPTKDGLLVVAYHSAVVGDITVDGESVFANSGTSQTYSGYTLQLSIKAGSVIVCTIPAGSKAEGFYFVPYND